MYQINNEKFGHFLAEVRKEKQMTQKDLADKLFVSDKTVSKWGSLGRVNCHRQPSSLLAKSIPM